VSHAVHRIEDRGSECAGLSGRATQSHRLGKFLERNDEKKITVLLPMVRPMALGIATPHKCTVHSLYPERCCPRR
jgi:hypothetical protein